MAHECAGTVEFVQALEAACEIDAVANDRVVEPFLVAHVADNHLGGVDTDTRGKTRLTLTFPLAKQGGQPILGSHRGHAGMVDMLVDLDRCAPKRHNRIANVFVECPPLGEDGAADDVEILTQVLDEHFRREVFGDGGEVGDVRKEDGQLPALTAQRGILLLADEL